MNDECVCVWMQVNLLHFQKSSNCVSLYNIFCLEVLVYRWRECCMNCFTWKVYINLKYNFLKINEYYCFCNNFNKLPWSVNLINFMECTGRSHDIQVCVTSGPQLIISTAVFSGFCCGYWHYIHQYPFYQCPWIQIDKITPWTQCVKSFYLIFIVSDFIILVLDILFANLCIGILLQ